ncbi:hypothetical protein HQS1_03510 [Delftia lacustris]|nr:hypothetical protein HQS1_03510 [Delftia lacustris]
MACHALGQSEGLATCDRFGNGCACTAAPAVFLRDVMGSALLIEKRAGRGKRSAGAGKDGEGHGLFSYEITENHRLSFYAQQVGVVVRNTSVAVRASLRIAPTTPETMRTGASKCANPTR